MPKLNKLVELLEKKNILFVEHCGFNNSTGSEDAYDAAKDHHIGICFYHSQDTEYAVSRGEVYLNFLPRFEKPNTMLEVGKIIAETAKDAGFTVEWNGKEDRRILIKGLDKEYFEKFLLADEEDDSDYD
jgi:hypothetical protein